MIEESSILPASFYDRPVLQVARELLGQRLVRCVNGIRMAGFITETEAYRGEEDLGCHARAGRTPRTEIMYGPPGRAYIYFTYGMHWLLNCVCEREGFAAAVLLRGIFAVEGIAQMLVNRPMPKSGGWLNGPAKLCQALGLDGRLNGAPLCQDSAGIWIEAAEPVGDAVVQTTPRIGLFSVPEPWKSIPWRFVVADEHLPYNRDITR